MQPTYLPWSGYFNLIHKAERFVFLDDVQLSRGWQYRNRILNHGQELTLSVSVKRDKREQSIANSQLDSHSKWRDKHIKSLRMAYGKLPYAKVLEPVYDVINDQSLSTLAHFNVALIKRLCSILDIQSEFSLASDLETSGKKSEKLLSICRAIDSKDYLSAQGSKAYIEEEGILEKAGIRVTYQDYPVRPYTQTKRTDFLSHLSVLDVLTHLGPEAARQYVTEPHV